VIMEGRSGREAVYAKSFVDCTAYGELAAALGASRNCGTRELGYGMLRDTLEKADVYFET